jgi:hypothetical protein
MQLQPQPQLLPEKYSLHAGLGRHDLQRLLQPLRPPLLLQRKMQKSMKKTIQPQLLLMGAPLTLDEMPIQAQQLQLSRQQVLLSYCLQHAPLHLKTV